MKMRGILLIFATAVAVTLAADDKKIVCYWGSWSVYRKMDGEFNLSYMDPKLCTHMIYTFIGLQPDGTVKSLDPWCDLPKDGGKDNFNRFNKLREQNPSLKTMVALGGWNEGSAKYSQVVGDPKLRHTLVDSIVAFVKKYNFDGFDLDWEYPVKGGINDGRPVDKENLILLLKELRERFDEEGLLLSAAVGAAESRARESYNIPEMSKYLHFINLMAYDLHGQWDKKTGMNAALYAPSSESDDKLNVDSIIKYWLSAGAPAEKLVLGVPFYGRSFTLNSQKYEVGTPASGGTAGKHTKEIGMLGYNEICEKIKNENWEVKYDEERKAVYAYGGDQWVSYDDVKTLKEKTDYIKKYKLGGAMVWSIETDDFRGNCGPKWPLLNALYRELGSGAPLSPSEPPKPKGEAIKERPQQPSRPQPAQQPQRPKPQPPQKPQQPQRPASSGKLCQAEGYVRDPQDCSKFYYCRLYNNVYDELPFNCPAPLVYDVSTSVCNWSQSVQC